MRVCRADIADLATVVMAICAVVVSIVVVRQYNAGPQGQRDRQVDNWEEYVSSGRVIGPSNARVQIVEFGDYECPFCRRLEPVLEQVLAKYPRDVALIHRHHPMPYHPNAYYASRLAECAADQGKFREAHRLLYGTDDLSTIEDSVFAAAIDVADEDAFARCANTDEPVPEVEEDLVKAEELEVRATPTVVVNGLRFGTTPDSARLFAAVEEALKGR